jgi:hypothetical protein
MIERREYISIRGVLIIGVIMILVVLMFSVKTDPVIVNMGNIGLPINAVDALRKLLGH